ncbi:hypothetical protein BDA99DRAFT_556215 [Phascolomyces articulosus]|uniref:RRM domain-containing protein n=1 Tax=Phascolomyces articulosus TaxID=60185 RepID=A0AAD5K961_9FUNG|nr:hypothetical protein BDA99DRAFT_556215 [Phascolomyces articulosus]
MTSEPLSTMTPFTSSSDIRIHPLAVSPSLYQQQQQQQNGNISGTSSTSSSSNGLFQQHPSSTTTTIDDVTTIFVVGFPDDMSEREFQNMFTFSLGFEAASLKWHCKDQEEVIVVEQSSLLTTPPLPPPLSSSSSTSSAMNISSTTNNNNNNNSNNNNSNNNAINNLSGKKQMIGFARFRTRLEAMEAVEVLNGKRVDQERGTLLKAEMAKKNLHIKRPSTIPALTQSSSTVNGINNNSNNNNNSNTASTVTSTISVASQNAVQAAVHAQAQAAQVAAAQAAQAAVVTADSISSPLSILSKKMQFPSAAAAAAVAAAHSSSASASTGGGGNGSNGLGVTGYDSFSPLPSDLLSPADYYKTDPFMKDPFQSNNGNSNNSNSSNGHPLSNNNNNNCSTPTTPVFNDSLFGFRSQSLDARNNSMDLGFMSPPRAFGLVPPPRMTKAVHQQEIAASAVPTATVSSSATMEDPFNYLSKSSPVPNDRIGFGTPASSSPPPSSSIFGTSAMDHPHPHPQHRMGSLSLHNPTNLIELRSHSISSPSYTLSMNNNNNSSNNNNGRSFNPADQNPPCNTLYVGNLPPNTSEEELRQLFSKCRAFKRMSFRNKAQGPMCFVEFEDVVYATQAMSDLQGYCLSNSVKGGIRLSFSKNPLFTKPNKDSMVQPISTSTANALKLLGSTTPSTPTSAQRDFVAAAFESATHCT